MGADEVEGADRTSASAAQAVRERVEAIRASVDIAQALGSDDSVIDLKTFQKLKAAFDEADEDGGGDLCVDEFVRAFQMVIPDIDEARLRHLFTRIDANADNTVDWDEFSSFILLEGIAEEKAREAMDGTEYVLCEDGPKGVVGAPVDKHKDMCTAVMRFQKGDSYATASRDGTIRVWAHDDSKGGIMTHRKTAKTGGPTSWTPPSSPRRSACSSRAPIARSRSTTQRDGSAWARTEAWPTRPCAPPRGRAARESSTIRTAITSPWGTIRAS